MPGSRISWNYNLTSYEAQRLLNVIEDGGPLEQSTGMSETTMSVVTEATWKSSNPVKPIVTTISRVNSDMSLYTPVRRRSIIQTPGVATRSNSARPSSRARSNRYSVPPTPNLSRQQSFESYRGGVMSMPPPPLGLGLDNLAGLWDQDSTPRVVTPCGDEYQSIGAFKLGTLRITNGAVSPASAGTVDLETGRDDNEEIVADSVDGFPQNLTTPHGLGVSDAALRVSSLGPAPIQPKATRVKPLSIPFLDTKLIDHVLPSPRLTGLTPTEAKPVYLAEINFTPFSLYAPSSSSLELRTTSKNTALEDELFEDDLPEVQVEYSSAEVLDVRLDPSAKSHPENTPAQRSSTTVVTRTDSGFVSATSPSSECSHHPLTKADSGYSSNVSLRSFHGKTQAIIEGEQFPVPPIEKHGSDSSRKSGSDVSANEKNAVPEALLRPPEPPRREAPPPPVPPKDYPPLSPTQARATSMLQKQRSGGLRPSENRRSTSSLAKKLKRSPSPIATFLSFRTGPKSPDSGVPHTPVSARSARSAVSAKSDSSNSALSVGSGAERGNKLQKLLSSSYRASTGQPTVHTTHVSEKPCVPAIPREVETKLRERTGLLPLATKRPALRPHGSLDTLKTILSVGSAEAAYDFVAAIPAVSPVFEAGGLDREETPEAVHRTYSLTSSITHVAAHLLARSTFTRKQVPTREMAAKERERDMEQHVAPSNTYDAGSQTSIDDGEIYFSPTSARRTQSLTASVEQNLYFRRQMPVGRPGTSRSGAELPSPSLPSPIFASMLELERRARTPPGMVSTRRPMSLRVPPALRTQSSTGQLNSQSLSRKTSREGVYSYPNMQPPLSLGRKPSREEVRSSYPPYQPSGLSNSEAAESPPPIPPMNPRRRSLTRTPNWEVQTDHGLSQQSSSGSVFLPNQPGSKMWQPPTNKPRLRHRASYDGYGQSQPMSGYGLLYGYTGPGYPPSMSNGYTGSSMKEPSLGPLDLPRNEPGPQQWDPYGQYPPQVHRGQGHYRNRSVGYGSNPPYRVLHSYNSPAYRNAPIWG